MVGGAADAHHGFAVFLCAQGRWFGLIASDPTVSRWFSTLAADAPAALADARAATRAWAAAGEHAPDHGITAEHPLTIDLDATLLDAPGDKEHASPTFERGHGFHPLCMFIDHVLDRKRWDTKEELRLAMVCWIERTYHRRRRQRGLSRLTPVEYEALNQASLTA
jgi:transposase InsO family protein